MGIPSAVIELDKTGTPFGKSTGKQAIAGEIRFPFFDAIKIQCFLTFLGEVHQFRSPCLHAVSHFIGFDTGIDFGISHFAMRATIQFV